MAKVAQLGKVPSPLVPLEQIPRVHLVRDVRELVAPAVGDDYVAAGLEGLQVVGHLGAEELRRVQRGLVYHHGHALGFHVLHDALDGARAEVVGVGLHRQAVDANDRLRLALVDSVPHHLQYLVGHEVLASAVAVHDGLDQVLRDVPVVGEQLLGVLGQAVAAETEAGVVVMAADARLQAHAIDDVAGVEAADLAVGVELVEVGHAQRQVGVGEELDGLGLSGAQHELRDAHGAVGVHALELGGVGAPRPRRRRRPPSVRPPMGIPDREESSRNRMVGWALIIGWKANGMIRPTGFRIETAD